MTFATFIFAYMSECSTSRLALATLLRDLYACLKLKYMHVMDKKGVKVILL